MEDGYKLQVTSKKYKNYTNYTWQTCVTQKIQTTPARSCKFQNCHPPPKKKETQDHNGGPATKCVVSNISGRPSCRWKSQGPWGGGKTKRTIWLEVSTLWNYELVSWGDELPNIWKTWKMFHTTNQSCVNAVQTIVIIRKVVGWLGLDANAPRDPGIHIHTLALWVNVYTRFWWF